MAKPTIVKRTVKGAALTYTEHDDNFENLRNATITVTGGATQVTADLNGTITLVAGSNVTITGNNSTKQITIASTGGASANAFGKIVVAGQSDVDADSSTDTLTLVAGSNVTLTTNSTTDTVTIASSVTGVTNPLTANLNLNNFTIVNTGGNLRVGDDINFPSGAGPFVPSGGELRVRGGTIHLESTNDPGLKVTLTTGTPSNTSAPTSYMKIIVNNTTRYIPYYT